MSNKRAMLGNDNTDYVKRHILESKRSDDYFAL